MLRVLTVLIALLAVAPAPAAERLQNAAAERLDWGRMPLPRLDGGTLAPDSLKGKVVLVVNTPSFCGYTHQYKALEAPSARSPRKGLALVGVPSNAFGGPGPES